MNSFEYKGRKVDIVLSSKHAAPWFYAVIDGEAYDSYLRHGPAIVEREVKEWIDAE